jgi:hypothetical protein
MKRYPSPPTVSGRHVSAPGRSAKAGDLRDVVIVKASLGIRVAIDIDQLCALTHWRAMDILPPLKPVAEPFDLGDGLD